MKLITLDRKHTLGIALSSLIFLTPLASLALTVEEVPNPRQVDGGWVTDMTDILSAKTEVELNKMVSQLEAQNGAEIAIVTVPETSPSETPKEFTTELFNYWGIGKAEEDNGVLFLVSTGDRRVEIETGYGIEPIVPDAEVGNIIDTKITPHFKQGNFDDGTLAGTQALVNILQNNTEATNQTSRETNNKEIIQTYKSSTLVVVFLLVGFILLLIRAAINSKKLHRRSDRKRAAIDSKKLHRRSDRNNRSHSSTIYGAGVAGSAGASSGNNRSRNSTIYGASSAGSAGSCTGGSSSGGGASSGGGGFGGGSSGGDGAGGGF